MRRLLAFLLLASLVGGCGGGRGGDASPPTDAAAPRPPVRNGPSGGLFARIPSIVRELEPSIVSIVVRGPAGGGEGSGVVWGRNGVVVTNDHVVENASSVEVVLASGERLRGRVRAKDPLTDLAVVEVDRRNLPPASFARRLPEQGELVLAMGNPLGFENTVTEGIVSGLHRSIPSGGRTPSLVDLIQTSAPISPGNSGGALVDMDGNVVGINVAYIPPGAGAVALGFAISSPAVVDAVQQLLRTGRVRHAFLGVRPGELTPQIADRLGLAADRGVLVRAVVEGSAADRAGLEAGDVVVRIGGARIDAVEDLLVALRKREPGAEVEIVVVRDGKRVRVTATLAGRPG